MTPEVTNEATTPTFDEFWDELQALAHILWAEIERRIETAVKAGEHPSFEVLKPELKKFAAEQGYGEGEYELALMILGAMYAQEMLETAPVDVAH